MVGVLGTVKQATCWSPTLLCQVAHSHFKPKEGGAEWASQPQVGAHLGLAKGQAR